MNEKFHKSIEKGGEEISLSHTQREQMRRTLHSYMEMKPLRAPASVSAPTFAWFFTLRPVAAALVLALFVSSAGISYAAEGALPGDFLYPVKIHLNEPVRGALAVSTSAKAEWAANVAGTRVQEAATLAAEGRLSTSTQQDLQASFEQHAQLAADALAQTATSSPDESAEAAVRFDAQLSEYQSVLTQIGTAKNVDVAPLTSSIQNERGAIAAIQTQTESSDTDHSAAAGMGIAARAQLDASTKLASAVSESLSSSSADIVAAQLDEASSSISAGEDFAAKNAGSDAIDAFQSALSATEKIGVFLQTSSAIHTRTGLVVAEPDNRHSKGARQSGPVTGVRAAFTATMMTASATSAEPAATTTPPEPGTGSGTNADVQTHAEDEHGGEAPIVPTLPVSVPVHLGL